MAGIRARRRALRNSAAAEAAPLPAPEPSPAAPAADDGLSSIRASLDRLLRSPRRRALFRLTGELKRRLEACADRSSPAWIECMIIVWASRRTRPSITNGLLQTHARLCRRQGRAEDHAAFRRLLTGDYGLTLPTGHGYTAARFADVDRSAVWAGVAGAVRRLEGLGLRVFLNSGTLLGPVRDGDLIGHDDDIDLAVILSAHSPAAAAPEWHALGRRLEGLGLATTAADNNPAIIKLNPIQGMGVDLFPAWYDAGDRLFVYPHTFGELPRAEVEPLAPWGAHALPIPRLPEAMLALNYGADWRVPQANFVFPWRRAQRRFAAFLAALDKARATAPQARRTVLTYGTFDLFHIGHVRLLQRLAALGDRLVVGCSTDEFNALKGKSAVFSYEQRRDILLASRFVSEVFPETHWGQKRDDIRRTGAGIFAMGDDWAGKFDDLADLCEVVYLPRTEGISSTEVKARVRSAAVAAG